MDILETDDVEPDCFEGRCIIPDPDAAGARALRIRQDLVRLADLNIGGAVLKMHGATKDDLDMLAFIEDELRRAKDESGGRA